MVLNLETSKKTDNSVLVTRRVSEHHRTEPSEVNEQNHTYNNDASNNNRLRRLPSAELIKITSAAMGKTDSESFLYWNDSEDIILTPGQID